MIGLIVLYRQRCADLNRRDNKNKMIDASGRKGPLTDIRLVELGQLIAGPFCGQLMADHGAEVIKVEAPGAGDPMREWGRGKPVWWPVLLPEPFFRLSSGAP